MKDFQYITNAHPAYIEGLYQDFVKDPSQVDADLRKFFEGFDFAVNSGAVNVSSNGKKEPSGAISETGLAKEFAVYQLINAYRKKGHLVARTNPIRERKDRFANLDLPFFGLNENDLALEFEAGAFAGLGRTTLQQILAHLQNCYTHHVGVEISALNEQQKIDWHTQSR